MLCLNKDSCGDKIYTVGWIHVYSTVFLDNMTLIFIPLSQDEGNLIIRGYQSGPQVITILVKTHFSLYELFQRIYSNLRKMNGK